ncbi:MAG: transposase, partial [Caldilineaceae bacterium SB0664_bin_22]|nr:transposase [Caldilineaceae bacterium SB0664_bin_22]
MSATVPRPEPLPAPTPLTAATVRGWQAQRAEVDRRLAPCFRRSEARQRAGAYVDGLLSDTRRKNGWQLAETVGDATPYGFQHLLGRAVWSADRARDELFAYVAEHLGDPAGVVVVDETGFPKQGTHSAGVGRQYCGTLGKVGNC